MLNQTNINDITPLSLGCLSVTGEQAKEFLQGQISCDLELTKNQHAILGLRFNIQGRVLATFRVIPYNNGYLLITAQDNIASLKQSLDKYAIFSKVTLEDCSNTFTIAGIYCHQTSKEACATQKPTPLYQYKEGIYYYKLFDDHHYEIIQDQQINSQLEFSNNTTNQTNWNQARLNALFPEITANMSELWTAHQLNLTRLNFVNFEKGCYLGQEIVARMEYRAKIKESLHLIKYSDQNDLPEPASKIFTKDDKNAGELVELHHCPDSEYSLGLAIIKHNYLEADLQLNDKPVYIIKGSIKE